MRVLSALIESVEDYVAVVVKNQRRCNRGQGVIEYAGALILSVILISTVLAIFPNPFTAFFFDIIATFGDYITDYAAANL